jgi:hypothetical protein
MSSEKRISTTAEKARPLSRGFSYTRSLETGEVGRAQRQPPPPRTVLRPQSIRPGERQYVVRDLAGSAREGVSPPTPLSLIFHSPSILNKLHRLLKGRTSLTKQRVVRDMVWVVDTQMRRGAIA